jgi:hypothetical protein
MLGSEHGGWIVRVWRYDLVDNVFPSLLGSRAVATIEAISNMLLLLKCLPKFGQYLTTDRTAN